MRMTLFGCVFTGWKHFAQISCKDFNTNCIISETGNRRQPCKSASIRELERTLIKQRECHDVSWAQDRNAIVWLKTIFSPALMFAFGCEGSSPSAFLWRCSACELKKSPMTVTNCFQFSSIVKTPDKILRNRSRICCIDKTSSKCTKTPPIQAPFSPVWRARQRAGTACPEHQHNSKNNFLQD